ncbi:MAG: Co2+/Mg2+ efflux protein ApaG [Polyangiaceae bacterium]|nr:Co2+/Mg2+ efflux protein ApaG [Polyangiaceae bacterium]
MSNSEVTTRGVRVEVESRYSPEHSNPAEKQWFFLYTVTIGNRGERPVRLLQRHWVILDATGHVEEVRGPGVVGQQPLLRPGEQFEYTSGCPLRTPFGSMRGSYQMLTDQGELFDAEIAQFALSEPASVQ